VSDKDREVSFIIRALDATATGLSSAKSSFKSWLGSVQGMVTTGLAAFGLGSFASRMVEEVSGAQRAISQLDNSLANIGVDLRKVRPDIDAAVASLQKVAAVDDDEAIGALNRLVQLSGDYRKSLANLPLVADVAAAKNIDLADAAERVGKIMAGTGKKALKDFGITTDDTAAAIEQLRAKVKGAAETELHTLGGELKAANVAFGDVAQAIGEVVNESPAFQTLAQDTIKGLRGIGTWLTTNKEDLKLWFGALVAVARETGRAVWDVAKIAFHAGEVIGNGYNQAKALLHGDMDAFHDFGVIGTEAYNEVGDAINDLTGASDRLGKAADTASKTQTAGLKRTREELEKNKRAHDALVASQKAEADAAAAKEAAKKQAEVDRKKDEHITQFEKAGSLDKYRGQSILGLRDLQAETEFYLRGNQSLERRLLLMDRLAKIEEALTKLHANANRPRSLEEIGDNGRRPGADPLGTKGEMELAAERGQAEVDRTVAGVRINGATRGDLKPGETGIDMQAAPSAGFGAQLGQSIKDGVGDINEGEVALQSLGRVIADITAGPLLAFGDAITASMEALVSGSGSAGKMFLSSMTNAIKGVAAAKGKLFAGEALGALGAGFLGHPGAFAAAAKYGAAAALMFALAGAAGGIGVSGGGGGGGGSTQQASASTQSALAGVGAGSMTVVFKGRRMLLDATNPTERDEFLDMLKTVSGNREIDFVIEDAEA
jgi:hypothetical protein